MLGTEQVNLIPRMITPLLEGVESIRVTDQVAKSMGLVDNQIVRGVVEDRQGLARLILNNRDFELKSSKKFKPGDVIEFRVKQSRSGMTLQAVSTEPTITSSTSNSINSLLSGGDTAKILSLFYRPSQPSSLAKLFSPESINKIMTQIGEKSFDLKMNQLMLSMRSFSPEMARAAMQNSGLFGESMLSKQSVNRADLKQFLRTILNFISANSPDRIMLNQAIDEIESNQLEAMYSQKNQGISYNFVIPFSDSDPVEINIEAEEADASDTESPDGDNKVGRDWEEDIDDSERLSRNTTIPQNWVVNLYTDSRELGEIWSKATLNSEMSVEMILWAADQKVFEIAKSGEQFLGELFSGFGISLGKFVVLNAERPIIEKSLTGPGQVLDVRT